MRLRMTVTGITGVSTDLTVEAEAGQPASALVATLQQELGTTASVLAHGGVALPLNVLVGHPPLVDGVSLTLLDRPPPCAPRSHTSPTVLMLDVVAGPDAGGSRGLTAGRYVIGRDPGCDLVVDDDGISRRQCAVTVSAAGVEVHDLESTNGTSVDGRPVDRCLLPPGGVLGLGATRLMVRSAEARPMATMAAGDGTISVHRSPHLPEPPYAPTFQRPATPQPPHRPRIPWLAILLPLPVCAALALLWGPQLLVFALLGPLVSGGTVMGERRAGARRYAAELADYRRLTGVVDLRIADARAIERRHLWIASPDPAQVQRTALERTARLWERVRGDPLIVRIGLGPVASVISVSSSPSGPLEPAEGLEGAPVTVDLAAAGIMGITGPTASRFATARSLVCQLVTLHSPADLGTTTFGVDPATGWSWMRWLPHRREHPTTASQGRTLIVASADSCGSPAWPDVVHEVDEGRAVVLVLAQRPEQLPAACRAVLDLDAGGSASLDAAHRHRVRGIVADGISMARAERVARALAPLRDSGPDSPALPHSAGLADVVGVAGLTVDGIGTAWQAPPPGLRAVVGVSANGPFSVDLVADGPHTLIGGTTGSGKSELLQAIVAGLAAAYPPDLVTFLLVDYKGGAAFRECADLPHTVGLVTDLDPLLAERALVSLRAEITRRESQLARAGATSLGEYRQRAGPDDEPLPRLVIVVDEFKMLIAELPGFVDGMVRLAAVGRSLGLHLVLATQRPAGAVTQDIQANVNLRIALRVRDRVDSEQVIESPVAAELPEDRPGRAVASTGSGRLVTFQTAHGGAFTMPTVRGVRVRVDGLQAAQPSSQQDSDLARLVQTVCRVWDARRSPPPRVPWLPPLPSTLAVSRLASSGPSAGVAIGLVDRPSHQAQEPLVWSPDTAPVLGVVGGPASGRTTLLRTLVGQLAVSSPSAPVHVYAVDVGAGLGAIDRLPLVGAVVSTDDTVRLRAFVDRLGSELDRRADALARLRLTTLTEWQAVDPASAPAYLLLLVDGWDALGDLAVSGGQSATDLLTLVDDLRTLVERGVAAGLRVVLTGGRALLAGRMTRVLASTLVLGRLDPADAALAGISRATLGPVTPAPLPPGRGVTVADGSFVQIAHLGADGSGAAQLHALATLADDVVRGRRSESPSPPPFTVGALPASVRRSALPPAVAGRDGGPFAVDGDGDAVGLDPGRDGRAWLVAGPRRSGRTTTLAGLAHAFHAAGRPVVWVAGRGAHPDTHALPPDVRILGVDHTDALIAARMADADLAVVVDDADLLSGAPVETPLLELTALAERGSGLVVCSADPATLAQSFRGLAVAVARHRTGVLLGPAGLLDGDVFGVRVPRATGRAPGRGYLIRLGVTTAIQVAQPDPPEGVAA